MARRRVETPQLGAINNPEHTTKEEFSFPEGFIVTPFDELVAAISQSQHLDDDQLARKITSIGFIPEEFSATDLQNYRAYLRGRKKSEPLVRKLYNTRVMLKEQKWANGLSYKQDLQFVVATLATQGNELGAIRKILGDGTKNFVGVNYVFDLMLLDLFEANFSALNKLAKSFDITITDDPETLAELMRAKTGATELSKAIAQLWLQMSDRRVGGQPENFQAINLRYVRTALQAFADEQNYVQDPRTRANQALEVFGKDVGSLTVSTTLGWNIGGHQVVDLIDRGYNHLTK